MKWNSKLLLNFLPQERSHLLLDNFFPYLILLREALSSSASIRFYDALTVYFVFTAASVVSRETQIASLLLIPQGLCIFFHSKMSCLILGGLLLNLPPEERPHFLFCHFFSISKGVTL
jgi:hypothetical protein